MTDKMNHGPDFLCIGMQKGGTRWIYDAMNHIPGAFMPPIKEFNHFAAMFGHKGKDYDVGKVFRRQSRRLNRTYSHVPQKLRAGFRAAVDRYVVSGSHADYLDLFSMGGNRITGDISPAYSLLSAREVAEVKVVLPNARIVLTVRHPVSRAWSHFNMHLRLQMARQGIEGSRVHAEIVERAQPQAFQDFLRTGRVQALSCPSLVYDRWRSVFGETLVIDFNQIVSNPAAVVAFLSRELMNQEIPERDAPVIANAKEKSAKVRMQSDHADIAYRHFSDEIARCRDRFDFASGWQDVSEVTSSA